MSALDDADFDQLYAAAWAAMVRLACLLLGNLTAAEDAVQDAFVNTYRHWSAIAGPAAARAYLRVAVINACRSVGRKRVTASRALVRHGNAELGLRDGTAAPTGPDPELITGLRALTRRQQEVLVLRYWADLSERDRRDAAYLGRHREVHGRPGAAHPARASGGTRCPAMS